MKPISYKYDVLYRRVLMKGRFVLSLRRYCFKRSLFSYVIQDNLKNYRLEERLSSSLSLEEMIEQVQSVFSEEFQQYSIDFSS